MSAAARSKLGLSAALSRTKGASLRYRIKGFYWELRYAWQRACKGYDFTDIFELGYNFSARMPILLREFKENNIALFTDSESGRTFTEEETNAVLDEMIFYFENCDEDLVYERMHGVSYYNESEVYDKTKWYLVHQEVNRCRNEAMRLFSKWCWHLWY